MARIIRSLLPSLPVTKSRGSVCSELEDIMFEAINSKKDTSNSILEILGEAEAAFESPEIRKAINSELLQPMKAAIASARQKVDHLQRVETHIDAIRAEIISPVANRLDLGQRHAILGIWLGGIGALLSLAGVGISVWLQASSVDQFQKTTQIVEQQAVPFPDQPLSEFGDFTTYPQKGTLEFKTKYGLVVNHLPSGRLTVRAMDGEIFSTKEGMFCPVALSTPYPAHDCQIRVNIFKLSGGSSDCGIGVSVLGANGKPCEGIAP